MKKIKYFRLRPNFYHLNKNLFNVVNYKSSSFHRGIYTVWFWYIADTSDISSCR